MRASIAARPPRGRCSRTTQLRRTRCSRLLSYGRSPSRPLAATAAAAHHSVRSAPDFGPNVKIIDPSMSTAQIKAIVDPIAAQQVPTSSGRSTRSCSSRARTLRRRRSSSTSADLDGRPDARPLDPDRPVLHREAGRQRPVDQQRAGARAEPDLHAGPLRHRPDDQGEARRHDRTPAWAWRHTSRASRSRGSSSTQARRHRRSRCRSTDPGDPVALHDLLLPHRRPACRQGDERTGRRPVTTRSSTHLGVARGSRQRSRLDIEHVLSDTGAADNNPATVPVLHFAVLLRGG